MLSRNTIQQAFRIGAVDLRAAARWLHQSGCNPALAQPAEAPSSQSATASERLFGVALLERLPIILPEPPKWQTDYEEKKFERDQTLRREYPPEFFNLENQSNLAVGSTGLDIEPAPRITEDDKSGNLKSLNRALDQRLYLMVQGRQDWVDDTSSAWHFPGVQHQDGETMRKCAERGLRAITGGGVKTYTVGNAPCGHAVLSPSTAPSAASLTKLFYYRIQLLEGEIKLADQRLQDFAWLTKSEILERIHSSSKDFFERMLVG